jgi:ABC-2 type transport system permease protein
MNIYMHEFKMNLKSVIVWSISLAVLILVFTSLYSSFSQDAALLSEMMDKFPKQLLQAFGMEGTDFSQVLGYFGLLFLFCQICLAIQAANYGFSMISVEEAEMTADFLMAKLVGRTSLLTSKLLSAFTGLTITNIIVWISSFVFINLFRAGREYDQKALIVLLLSIVLFQLFFLTLGLLISMLVKKIRSVTPYSMALVFGLYVLNAFGAMLGEQSLEVVSPFKHFDPSYIVKYAALDLPLVSISLAVTVISFFGSYWLFSKRNILTAV